MSVSNDSIFNKVRELLNQGKTMDQLAIETSFSKTCIKEYIKDYFLQLMSIMDKRKKEKRLNFEMKS